MSRKKDNNRERKKWKMKKSVGGQQENGKTVKVREEKNNKLL